MHSVLSVTYQVFLCLFLLAGVVMIPFTLPGTWVIVVASFLYALVRDYQASADWKVIAVLAGLALLGELIEFLTGTLGPAKEKVPTGAIVCSVIGGIAGAIIGVPVFLIGALLGLLLGSFFGAFLYCLVKDGHVRQALRHSWLILTSRVIAIFAKTAIGAGMVVFVLFKVF